MPKRSLRSIVVPWNTVIRNEGKQRILVPLKPLPISRRRVAHGILSRDHVSVETIYPTLVFTEMARFETEPLSIFEEWNQKTTNSANKLLEFIVKWIFPKIVIHVPDQMDEAPLLLTRQRIVPSIKIRYDGALEPGKQRLQKLRFTVRA